MTSTKVCGRTTTSCPQMLFEAGRRRSPMLSSRAPSRRRDRRSSKNAAEAYGSAKSLPSAGKINAGHGSSAGGAFFPRRLAGRGYSTWVSSEGRRIIAGAILMTFALTASVHAQSAVRNAGERGAGLADRIQAGDRRAALAMIAEGADVNQPQPDGTTPLHWAAYRVD